MLLLDEPTKELDPLHDKMALDVIAKEGERRLVIMVTHKSEDVKELGATEIKIN